MDNLPAFHWFRYLNIARVALLIRKDAKTGNVTAWEFSRDDDDREPGYKTYNPIHVENLRPTKPWPVPAHVREHWKREGIELPANPEEEFDLDDVLFGAPALSIPAPADTARETAQALQALAPESLEQERLALWIGGQAPTAWADAVHQEYAERTTPADGFPPLTRFYVASYTGLSCNWLLGPYPSHEEALGNVAKAMHFAAKTPELDAGAVYGVMAFPEDRPSISSTRYGR